MADSCNLSAMIIRRYEAIIFGIALLLCGAVSHSSVELPNPLLPKPEITLTPRHPWIALTFDDGPHAGKTEQLLNVLKEAGVPATFFVVGKMAVRYPNLVREIAREGHEVANHTFTHPNLARVNDETLLNELGQTRQVIEKLTGQDTMLYRPPGGDFSRRSLKVASDAGYHMILWTVLTKDVSGASAAAMRRHILNSASDGAIVLMHSGMPNTVEMLPGVIAELRQEGYHFVTVSQLLGFDHSHGGFQPVPVADSPAIPVALKPAAFWPFPSQACRWSLSRKRDASCRSARASCTSFLKINPSSFGLVLVVLVRRFFGSGCFRPFHLRHSKSVFRSVKDWPLTASPKIFMIKASFAIPGVF